MLKQSFCEHFVLHFVGEEGEVMEQIFQLCFQTKMVKTLHPLSDDSSSKTLEKQVEAPGSEFGHVSA